LNEVAPPRQLKRSASSQFAMSRIRIVLPILVATGLLVGVPLAWWLSLRREVALTSPNGRYSVHLAGRFSRPIFGVMHTVYASVLDSGNEVVGGRQIHTGDWMDPWFDLWYPRQIWVNNDILRLTRPQDEALNEYDQITVRNSASRTVRLLRVDCRDMFLILDITPGQVKTLQAPKQARYSEHSWLKVDGQFSDGRDLQAIGKNFTVFGRAHYSIDIRDDKVEMTIDDVNHTTTPNKSLDASGGSVFRN
jgi:hypothetical protein